MFTERSNFIKLLGVDINDFQSFEEELTTLPGKYCPARKGGLWVMYKANSTSAVACVALRCHEWPAAAEIKRLYVCPSGRQQGLGRILSLHAMQHAVEIGYNSILLDSLERQAPAVRLYESLGFQRVPQYIANPEPDAVFMGFSCTPRGKASITQQLSAFKCDVSVWGPRLRMVTATAAALLLGVAVVCGVGSARHTQSKAVAA